MHAIIGCPSSGYWVPTVNFLRCCVTLSLTRRARDGRNLSYVVEYDDGDVEKVVKRGHIAPFPEEVSNLLVLYHPTD